MKYNTIEFISFQIEILDFTTTSWSSWKDSWRMTSEITPPGITDSLSSLIRSNHWVPVIFEQWNRIELRGTLCIETTAMRKLSISGAPPYTGKPCVFVPTFGQWLQFVCRKKTEILNAGSTQKLFYENIKSCIGGWLENWFIINCLPF